MPSTAGRRSSCRRSVSSSFGFASFFPILLLGTQSPYVSHASSPSSSGNGFPNSSRRQYSLPQDHPYLELSQDTHGDRYILSGQTE
jgi:hypothetical protein